MIETSPFAFEPLDQLEDQPALLRPHRGQGLVEQEDVGLAAVDRPRDRDRLPLPAG